mgnify:CR=1 FL=1
MSRFRLLPRGGRCRMYRLREGHHDPVHEPATCRRCWAACRDTPQEGRSWCARCEAAAAASGNLWVVAHLDDLTEPPTTPDELVDYLTGA